MYTYMYIYYIYIIYISYICMYIHIYNIYIYNYYIYIIYIFTTQCTCFTTATAHMLALAPAVLSAIGPAVGTGASICAK